MKAGGSVSSAGAGSSSGKPSVCSMLNRQCVRKRANCTILILPWSSRTIWPSSSCASLLIGLFLIFDSESYCGTIFKRPAFVSFDLNKKDGKVIVNHIAKENGFVQKGDMLVNLAAMPVVDKGMVNTLRISEIE